MQKKYVCWKNLLSDIEYDNRSLEEILSEKITKRTTTTSDLETILNDKCCEKWFLNAGYSDEFEDLCATSSIDFDNLVDENIDKVFYQSEKTLWSKRLLAVAYLKLEEREYEKAEAFYNLYYDEKLKLEFFKNILKKSIYEYYVSLKFNTELNNGKYSLKELDEIISQIEELWVCTK